MTMQELDDASIALTAWCKSQSIHPADGVLLMEYTIARMIVENRKSAKDEETKIDLCSKIIQTFVTYVKAHI